MDRTLKFRHQRRADDTLESFDSWILLIMLPSRDMAKSVSQEAYVRASYTLLASYDLVTSAHVINQSRVLTPMCLFSERIVIVIDLLCVRVRAFFRW